MHKSLDRLSDAGSTSRQTVRLGRTRRSESAGLDRKPWWDNDLSSGQLCHGSHLPIRNESQGIAHPQNRVNKTLDVATQNLVS